MMERFLKAGITVDDALRTVAPAFRMRVEGMRGVTLDALTVDLYSGKGVSDAGRGHARGDAGRADGRSVFGQGELSQVRRGAQLSVEGMRGVTLDALTVDLYSGKASCLKCGAAPSYLRTGGGITTLAGESLPIGLMESPEEATPIPLRMLHGDLFILLSDGVSDGTDDGITTLAGESLPIGLMESPEEATPIPLRMLHGDLFILLSDGVSDGTDDGWVKKIVEERAGDSPKELAARLVAAAEKRGASDDLTALVVRLERRKPAV